jgi:hypothetical protein
MATIALVREAIDGPAEGHGATAPADQLVALSARLPGGEAENLIRLDRDPAGLGADGAGY